MIFNSIDFFVFITIFFLLLGIAPKKYSNWILLASSYFFYGYWNWKLLGLIFISTAIDFYCGEKIYQNIKNDKAKRFLCVSLVSNLGLLAFFKYFNFFLDNVNGALSFFDSTSSLPYMDIILPVGISFYTFQSMSYSIDIYRGDIKPCNKFSIFALYVSYFPQLVAGPIERASKLLPQLSQNRQYSVDNINRGISLIIIGFFKKCVIADNLAEISNSMFNNPSIYSGAIVLVAVYSFSFQIYCDFSGYTDIARGLSKMIGVDLMLNFRNPYFAVNPSDFWKRWHISLSQWLRDYLYIGVGGNRGGNLKTYRNLMITMGLGGLWHGASWNFIYWGIYHGALLIIHRLTEKYIIRFYKVLGFKDSWQVIVNRIIFFHLICFSWILFRINKMDDLSIILSNMMVPVIDNLSFIVDFLFYSSMLLIIDLIEFKNKSNSFLQNFFERKKIVISATVISLIAIMGAFNNNEFIYFQF